MSLLMNFLFCSLTFDDFIAEVFSCDMAAGKV